MHVRIGESRFNEAIASTVSGLGQYQQAEAKRIEWLRNTELPPDQANSLILQAYESGIIGARLLPDVIQEWRQPKHPEFREKDGMEPLERVHGSAQGSSAAAALAGRPRDDHPAEVDRRRVRYPRASRLTDDAGFRWSSTPLPPRGGGFSRVWAHRYRRHRLSPPFGDGNPGSVDPGMRLGLADCGGDFLSVESLTSWPTILPAFVIPNRTFLPVPRSDVRRSDDASSGQR